MKYNIVFVVLVYRNTKDLEDFFAYNHIHDSHTVVVVSHYDDSSDKVFIRIASDNNADIIIVPNKGYGAGNNMGIEYALEHFDFNYIVISNADISIRILEPQALEKYGDTIIAPDIVAANGKQQNPNEPYKPSNLAYHLMYKTYKNNKTKLIWLFYALARVRRIVYNMVSCVIKKDTIYSAHGSFVIIPANVLNKLKPLYNEKMFLMNEESHLAMKAREYGVKTVYAKDILIDHKEDGSMSLEYKNEFPLLKQSFMEFYEYWFEVKK